MPQAAELVASVRAGDRDALARAITLIESSRPDDRAPAERLLRELMPSTGKGIRLAISGAPGAGKSTFIDALGTYLLEQGVRVAVLAVDPSSTVSGGSILGDKTRMARLARDERAYIRPSPSATTLGGVARRTGEAMLLCEAAGFGVVIIETVGVGQSETVVADMVDTLLVLVLPRAGDELQGIKKGILELADLVAVNKADGDNLAAAREAAVEYNSALRYLRPAGDAWRSRALMTSALTGDGVADVWDLVLAHRDQMTQSGAFAARRRQQSLRWMQRQIEERLLESFHADPAVRARTPELEAAVLRQEITPTEAANRLIAAYELGASGHGPDPEG